MKPPGQDWQRDQPLSFYSQRPKFIEFKKRSGISGKQIRHIARVLELAEILGHTISVKAIGKAEIDDFSSKTMAWAINTLSNWKSVLTDFWTWLVRPGELRNVQEGHINLQEKWIVFPQPRKRDPKFIHLLPQHCELIQSIWPPRALPHIYFSGT